MELPLVPLPPVSVSVVRLPLPMVRLRLPLPMVRLRLPPVRLLEHRPSAGCQSSKISSECKCASQPSRNHLS
jgi:hypothetical protein